MANEKEVGNQPWWSGSFRAITQGRKASAEAARCTSYQPVGDVRSTCVKNGLEAALVKGLLGFHILFNVYCDWGGDGRSLKSSMSSSANLQFALEGNIKLCACSVSQTK